MNVKELSLKGAKLICPTMFKDDRGFFFEAYHQDRYFESGIDCTFVQDNHSLSKQGVIRGMHFQSEPGQAKLVRVIQGKIFDVIVDIRPHSPTFGEWEGVYLNNETHQQLFIPVGFAHGFCVISPEAHVLYKVSALYHPKTEQGFRYDDPDIGIKWPVENPVVSERDQDCPSFRNLKLKVDS